MYVCMYSRFSGKFFVTLTHTINGGGNPFADYLSNFEILDIPVVDTPHC